jgi:hypothetical protein
MQEADKKRTRKRETSEWVSERDWKIGNHQTALNGSGKQTCKSRRKGRRCCRARGPSEARSHEWPVLGRLSRRHDRLAFSVQQRQEESCVIRLDVHAKLCSYDSTMGKGVG